MNVRNNCNWGCNRRVLGRSWIPRGKTEAERTRKKKRGEEKGTDWGGRTCWKKNKKKENIYTFTHTDTPTHAQTHAHTYIHILKKYNLITKRFPSNFRCSLAFKSKLKLLCTLKYDVQKYIKTRSNNVQFIKKIKEIVRVTWSASHYPRSASREDVSQGYRSFVAREGAATKTQGHSNLVIPGLGKKEKT